MVDTRTPEQRRKIMQSVKGKNTGPELVMRRALFQKGYRFRLHRRDLPGSPDIVFPRLRKVLFVHGCFWHGHSCPKGRLPKSNIEYWGLKIEKNRRRDSSKIQQLDQLGWDSMVVWQCEMKEFPLLMERVVNFLHEPHKAIDKPAKIR